jgi:hypothetical protein
MQGVAKRTQPQDAGRQILRLTVTIRRRASCTSLTGIMHGILNTNLL